MIDATRVDGSGAVVVVVVDLQSLRVQRGDSSATASPDVRDVALNGPDGSTGDLSSTGDDDTKGKVWLTMHRLYGGR